MGGGEGMGRMEGMEGRVRGWHVPMPARAVPGCRLRAELDFRAHWGGNRCMGHIMHLEVKGSYQ